MLSTTCETTKFCGYDRALFSMAHGTNVEAARDDVLLQAIFSDHARAAVSTRWLSEWLCWSRDEPRSGTLAARLQAFFSGDSSKFRGLWCSFGGFFTSSFKLFLLHSFSNVVALARLTAGVVSPVPISMPSPPRLYLPPRTPVASIVEHAMAHYAHCGVPELGDFFQCFVRVSGLCMDQTYQEYVADRMLSGSPIQTYSHEWECKFLRQLSSFTCAWSD